MPRNSGRLKSHKWHIRNLHFRKQPSARAKIPQLPVHLGFKFEYHTNYYFHRKSSILHNFDTNNHLFHRQYPFHRPVTSKIFFKNRAYFGLSPKFPKTQPGPMPTPGIGTDMNFLNFGIFFIWVYVLFLVKYRFFSSPLQDTTWKIENSNAPLKVTYRLGKSPW